MPELPETFVIASQLAMALGTPFESDSGLKLPQDRAVPGQFASGAAFEMIPVGEAPMVFGDEIVIDMLRSAAPTLIRHRGKKIWISWKTRKEEFDTLVRLSMTGSFTLRKTKHSRAEFRDELTSASFFFNDIRKFGKILVSAYETPGPSDVYGGWSITSTSLSSQMVWELMQSDPLSSLKETITSQNVFSGVGNYLANEILFAIHLHPDSHIGSLTLAETEKMIFTACHLAQKSVTAGGCTLRTYSDILQNPGRFQEQLKIYGKKECVHCHEPVVVIRRDNETTSWVCPSCQELRLLTPTVLPEK